MIVVASGEAELSLEAVAEAVAWVREAKRAQLEDRPVPAMCDEVLLVARALERAAGDRSGAAEPVGSAADGRADATLLRRQEVATELGKSVGYVDHLRREGVLEPVRLTENGWPHYRLGDVRQLMKGATDG